MEPHWFAQVSEILSLFCQLCTVIKHTASKKALTRIADSDRTHVFLRNVEY